MSYKQQTISDLLKMYASKLVIVLMAIAITILAWANIVFDINNNANAVTIQSSPLAVTAEGISDQAEGTVEKNIGKAQRKIG
ncbi:MAG: CsbD family protein, partial [Waterburya sp.]